MSARLPNRATAWLSFIRVRPAYPRNATGWFQALHALHPRRASCLNERFLVLVDDGPVGHVVPDAATGSRVERPVTTDGRMREFAVVDRSGNRVGGPMA